MQYILVNKNDTLTSVSNIVGASNVDTLLAENGLTRSPKIGKQWMEKCETLLASNPAEVSSTRKMTLLNGLTNSEEVFEKACLMDENEWKIFDAYQSFPDTLRVPETVTLPYSSRVIGNAPSGNEILIDNTGKVSVDSSSSSTSGRTHSGGGSSTGGGGGGSSSTSSSGSSINTSSITAYSQAAKTTSASATAATYQANKSDPVDTVVYKKVMNQLATGGDIDPAIFNTVNSSYAITMENQRTVSLPQSGSSNFSPNLPWGKIQLYSSLLDEAVDIPAYPEEGIEESRVANYTQMPDIIYQYEPWVVYQSSGPREQSLTFHLHRDMWSGNHLDGQANNLVSFCKANTFPRYTGSAVLSPTVSLYIDGSLYISGVLTSTRVNWRHPIGRDNWYLDFDLSLTIQEFSPSALSIDTVRNIGLKGT